MKALLMLALAFLSTTTGLCQKYISDKSFIRFYSDAAIEDITADNKKASSIFDSGTSEVVFSVPINQFQFDKALMKEHFNEKYMQSEKYPTATFQGKVEGFDAAKEGDQNATARGKLSIHGVTREVSIPGVMSKKGSRLSMKSKFIVKLADHNIEIPQLLWQNIAEQVEVTVDFNYRQK